MFEAIIITLREGVEAALVLAIALSFLRRRQRLDLVAPLFAGTAVAVVASGIAAVLISRIPYNQELTEGIIMLVGAVLVFSLVYFMWRAAPHMKHDVETAVERAAAGVGATGMFLFAFGMIFREGLETAVFLSAAHFNSQGIGIWLGAGLGLAVAVAFGVLFVRGMIRVPLGPFFTITSAVLVLLGLQLLVGGLHELSEAQLLPSSRTEMAILGPIVKNELILFTLTVALVAGWLLLAPVPAPAEAPDADGAQARLARARQTGDLRRRRWTGALGLLVVVVLATAFVQGSHVPAPEPASPLALENDRVSFATADLADGRAHFFQADAGNGTVRFFAMEVEGGVRTCLDGCEICGDIGYFKDGHNMVCRNCMSPIATGSLGRSGGCNPIPLPSHVEGDSLVVMLNDLEAALPRLKGH